VNQQSLTIELAAFAAELRTRGMAAAPSRVVESARALTAVDVTDHQEFYLALRCTLPVSAREVALFDRCFAEFWRGRFELEPRARTDDEREEVIVEGVGAPMADAEPVEERDTGIASPFDALGSGLRSLGRGGEATLDELAARTALALAWRPSRRYRPSRQGTRFDPRRTMRASLRAGGVPVILHRRSRQVRKARIVALCDVSRSMEPYARLLLRYVVALSRRSARVEAFVFTTHLRRITPLLRRRGDAALEGILKASPEWGGGTRIGLSLSEFVQFHAARVLDRQTVVLLASDGLDTGDPAMVSTALRAIRSAAGAIIWLNPLVAAPDYSPRARAMAAALPYLDLLVPGDSLASLESVVDRLGTSLPRRSAAASGRRWQPSNDETGL
jgi:uncharacterized protein